MKLKHFHYFWVTAIIILSLGIISLFDEESVIDINVHDTYFVIHHSHLAFFLSFFYGLFGLIYWSHYSSNVELVSRLTTIHTVVTIGSIPVYFLGLKVFELYRQDGDFPLFDDLSNENLFITIIFLLVLLAQVLFLINIILSLVKHLTKRIKE